MVECALIHSLLYPKEVKYTMTSSNMISVIIGNDKVFSNDQLGIQFHWMPSWLNAGGRL